MFPPIAPLAQAMGFLCGSWIFFMLLFIGCCMVIGSRESRAEEKRWAELGGEVKQ